MTFIGQSTRRVEDERFLTGRGTFVDDVNLPGQLWAYVVRSPHAHAVIERIDTGGGTVFTHQDIVDVGLLPCATQVATVAPMLVPPRPALANGKVRHVGDPVAFVIAETPAAARDAAERVVVDYRPLPSVVDAAAALKPSAPLLWDDIAGNLSFRFQKGDPGAVAAAMARAAHIVELELINNRLIIAPTETRAAIARFEQDTFSLLVSAASVHAIRDQLAGVFHVPTDKILVSAPDVGGGFGIKNALYPEWVMMLWAARHLGRPIKWVQDRAEDFVSTAQGRDNRTTARLGLASDGRFLALDVSTIANLGAYMSGGGPGSSTNAPANAMGGGYDIPAIAMDVRAAFTNTVPIDAYRGAGKPEANYLMERLIDLAARRYNFDPAELRRRNMIASFPYTKALGSVVDGGRFAANILVDDDGQRIADPAHRFCRPSRRVRATRSAAWTRSQLLHGNGAGSTERGGRNSFRQRWYGGTVGRNAIERAGARNQLPANSRRFAWPAAGVISLHAGRYRAGPRRQRSRWCAIHAHGGRRDVPGRQRGYRQRTRRRCVIVAGPAGRGQVRCRPVHRAANGPLPCSMSRARRRARHLCLEPAGCHHVPERVPHPPGGGGRPRHRTRQRWTRYFAVDDYGT